MDGFSISILCDLHLEVIMYPDKDLVIEIIIYPIKRSLSVWNTIFDTETMNLFTYVLCGSFGPPIHRSRDKNEMLGMYFR